MTEAEVTALSSTLAGVVRDVVARAFEELRLETLRESGAVRERLAVLETRAPVPGPPGRDGLGVQDFDVTHDGERTWTLRWATDTHTVERMFTVPVLLYRGIWTEGRTYAVADVVTHQRSAWVCRTTTATRPGEQAEAWQLMVMRGRDGKDGRP